MAIRFITNRDLTHKKELIDLFRDADEIIFAVGFFRNSGLQSIKDFFYDFCKDKSKKSTFFIGTGMGSTEPSALERLFTIIKGKANHQLILCSQDEGIFHPKIYVFVSGTKATIVTGSANLTGKGWLKNDEVSMLVETTTDSAEYMQLNKYFNVLRDEYQVDDVQKLIELYKHQVKEFNKKNPLKPPFRFKRISRVTEGIDLQEINSKYKDYIQSEEFIDPEERVRKYKTAKTNLEILASNQPLTVKEFHDLFGPLVGHKGYDKLWHSGGIHRHTHKTLDYVDSFRELVRVIQGNISKPASTAYDNVVGALKTMKKRKIIFGIGENIIAEMLLTYDPQNFANLNDNPLFALSLMNINLPASSSFNGENYKEYTRILTLIKEELKMATFLEVDSFLNYLYWEAQELM